MARVMILIDLILMLMVQPALAELDMGHFDFGRVRLGSAQHDTVFFKNEQLVTLMVTNISTTRAEFDLPATPFTGDQLNVSPDQARAIPICFVPQDTGQIVGHIQIETHLGAYQMKVQGEGVAEVVVINEVLADPPPGILGDANGDGSRNSNEDEFVELLNTGKYPVNMGGWQLFDHDASLANRLTFPNPTWLDAQARVTVFGGPPLGISGTVFGDDGRIGGGLRNSGDRVILYDPTHQDTMATMSYGSEGAQNVSMVRWPEGIGPWRLHTEIPGEEAPFSANTASRFFEHLVLSPTDTTISVGDTLIVRGTAIYKDGEESSVRLDQVSWSASEEEILQIVGVAQFVGLNQGTAWVGGQAFGLLKDSIHVTVLPPKVVGIKTQIQDTVFVLGEEKTFDVIAQTSSGTEVHLVNGFEIALSDTSILEANTKMLRAKSPGSVVVSVSHESFADTLTLQVVALGDLNRDGAFTLWDAIRTVHLILGISPPATDFETKAADVNHDLVIDLKDLIAIIRRILGEMPALSKAIPDCVDAWWQRTPKGVVVHVPPQTMVLSFSTKNPQDLEEIKPDVGNLYLPSMGLQHQGIIVLPIANPLQDASQTIQIDGLRRHEVLQMHAWTLNGQAHFVAQRGSEPPSLRILEAAPNPLNPSTSIRFHIPDSQLISLDVYNVNGQLIRSLIEEKTLDSGVHSVIWDAKDSAGRGVASGVYFVRLDSFSGSDTHKLLILR